MNMIFCAQRIQPWPIHAFTVHVLHLKFVAFPGGISNCLSINGPPWIALFVGVQCVAIFVCFHVPKRSSRESELQSNIQFSHKLVCVDGHRSYTCFMHLGYDSCTIPCDVAVPFLGSILIRSFTKCFDKTYRYELFPVTDDIPFTE